MKLMKPFVLLFCLSAAIACAQSTELNPPGVLLSGARTNVAVPQQAWQVRRAAFWKAVKDVNAGDLNAGKDLDAVLKQFETQPVARTPLENMDILGLFYAPKEEIGKTLILVTLNAALGWYDALRFGSASGRDEIMNRDRLFVRTFMVQGATMTDKFKEFMKGNPDLARKSVQLGLALAEQDRNNTHYDVRWPTAFGLERVICAEGGSCDLPKEMPADQWDKAWEEAKKRVTSYYQVNAAPSPANN